MVHIRVMVRIVCLVLSFSSVTMAQSRWIVLSADVGATTQDDSVARVESALGLHGQEVMDSADAAAQLETAWSSAFRTPPDDLVHRLGVVTEAVLTDVAQGDSQAGIDRARSMLEEIEPHLAGLGRDQRPAEDVGNLCYFVVRAHLQKQDVGAARQQLNICRRIAPGFQLNHRLHPPEVHQQQSGSVGGDVRALAVQLVGGNPDCVVRLQGRQVGSGTRVRIATTPGRYAVQAECDGTPGRVHVVRVSGDRPARVDIDVRFDQAFRTNDDRLSFEYSSDERLEADLHLHLTRVGERLSVGRALVRVRGQWQAFRLDAGTVRPIAEAVPGLGQTSAEADRIVTAILGRRTIAHHDDAVSSRSWIGGIVVTLAGLAVNVAGWKYQRDLDDAYAGLVVASVSDQVRFQSAIDDAYARGMGLATVGAAALLIGVPLLLPRRDGVPWWSWVMGGVGVGAGIWAATAYARKRTCIRLGGETECARRVRREVEGTLLLSYAVPLLLTPIIYLIRNARSEGGLSISAGPRHATLNYQTALPFRRAPH